MPEYQSNQIASRAPFSADIIVRHEAHEVSIVKDNGYTGQPIKVDGGVLLNIKLSANGLPELKKMIEGHIALIE